MAFKKFLKKAGKRVYKASKRFVKKRYGGPKGISRVVKDVAMLKHLVNVEKKRISIINSSLLVGQVFANLAGYVAQDITPVMSQGLGVGDRMGSSIKIVSCYFKFQFWSQSANNHTTRLRMEFWKIPGETVNANTELAEIYNITPNTGIVDYQSLKNPDYFGGARKFMTKYVNIPAPQYSGQTQIKELAVPLRMDHHIRFNANTTSVVGGQIIMFIFADSGNTSSTVSTLTNVPVTLGLSAITYNQDLRFYYTDN